MAIVVDASVALSWCFRDEISDYADRVLELVSDDSVSVPAVWSTEMANGLHQGWRRTRITEAELHAVADMLLSLDVTTYRSGLELALGAVMSIAREQGLTAYDASYLELAMRERLPLATQDDALIAAAKRVGVPLVP